MAIESPTASLADVAEGIRQADDEQVWNEFGHEIQRKVIDAEPDDTTAVVMTLTVSASRFAHDGVLAVKPAVTWAVDDIEGTKETLADNGDALVVWRGNTPVVDDIRRKVADALERADND